MLSFVAVDRPLDTSLPGHSGSFSGLGVWRFEGLGLTEMICLAETQGRREDFWFLNHFCYLHSFKLCGLVRENIVGKWRIGKAGELLGRWEV